MFAMSPRDVVGRMLRVLVVKNVAVRQAMINGWHVMLVLFSRRMSAPLLVNGLRWQQALVALRLGLRHGARLLVADAPRHVVGGMLRIEAVGSIAVRQAVVDGWQVLLVLFSRRTSKRLRGNRLGCSSCGCTRQQPLFLLRLLLCHDARLLFILSLRHVVEVVLGVGLMLTKIWDAGCAQALGSVALSHLLALRRVRTLACCVNCLECVHDRARTDPLN